MSSSAPYLCSRELLSSSGVLCSTFFKSSNYDYLLTLTANRINIYSVHLSPSLHSSSSSHPSSNDQKSYYLVHCLSNQLFGKPQDLYPITVSSTTSTLLHQHLLVTFDSGKLIVLNYNRQCNQIDVVKLYNAEIGALGDNAIDHHHESLGRNVYPGVGDCPFISYDNINGISAVTLYSYKILFISHRSTPSSFMTNSNLKPFVTDLATLNLSGAIIDICFLSGYSRPTLAVLQDVGALPIGHAYQVRHTCCVTVLAVDMITESCVVMWKQDELPHDSFKLMKPDDGVSRGGVIVLSMNAILIVSQESIHGLATNGFAKVTVSEHIPLVPWPLRPGIELHTSRWVDITPPPDLNSSQSAFASSYLVSLSNGMLFLIRMEAFGGETICGGNIHYDVEVVAQSIHASCMSVLHLQQIDSPAISVDSNTSINNSTYSCLLLLGSTVSDCLLLHTTLTITTESVTNLNPVKTGVRLFSQSSSNDLSENSMNANLGGNNNALVSSIYSTPNVKRQRKGSWQSPFMTPNGESKSIENGSDYLFLQLAKKEEEWLYDPAETETSDDVETRYKPPGNLLNPNDLINESEVSSASASNQSALKNSYHSDSVVKKKLIRMNFHLLDTLVVVGPILSGDVVSYDDAYNLGFTNVAWTRDDILQRNRPGSGPSNIAAYIVDREQKEVLQFCVGSNSESSLLKVTQGKRMSKIAARNFFDISSLCSLHSSSSKCCFLLLSREGGGSVQYLAQGMGRSANLASREGNTRVIKVHEKLNLKKNNELHFYEILPETSCFIHDQRTISIGYVLEMKEKSICVQACSKGLRVIQISVGDNQNEVTNVVEQESASSQGNSQHHPSDKMTMTALHDCLLEEDIELGGMGGMDGAERILYVDYSAVGGWVAVLSTFGIVYVLQYQPNDESLELKFKLISNEVNKDIEIFSPTSKLNHQEIPQHTKLISVSLFTGHLPLSFGPEQEQEDSQLRSEKMEESKVSPSLLEEVLLYGAGDGPRNEKEFLKAKSANIGINGGASESEKIKEQTKIGVYLVIVDRMGSVSIVQISSRMKQQEIPMTPKKLFQTPPLGSLPNFIRVTSIPHESTPSSPSSPESFPVPPKRFTTEARLCVLGKNDDIGTSTRPEELKLCLITTLNTGDVLIYTAVEDRLPPHSINLFVKLDHSFGTRRRRAARSNAEKLRKAARGESLTSSPPDLLGLGFTVFQSMISLSFDTNKGTIVTISGVHPLVITNEKGIPNVQSLGLPELPYAGSGIYLLTSFFYGTMSGLAVLWREEKLDLNDASQLMLSGGLRAVSTLSTLGLYQDIPNLISTSYSNTSMTRQNVGYTTHKITEFNENKTEDSTQKALLKSKTTYLLNCSQIIERNFDHNIFTPEEISKEEGLYDRFFPDLTSFHNPMNNEIGAPPKLNEVEYRLSIMQNGAIVDSYLLPKGEKILDSTILYLTVSDKSVPPPPLPPHGMEDPMKPPLIGKKRVFIAACTGIDDKHGEDTQGEGRLLFFSLDYAMYQDDELQLQQQDISGSNSSGGGEGEMKDLEGNQQPLPPPPPLPHHPRHLPQHLQEREKGISAAQKKFYGSIKPKLRLLWAGPGPGTVVTQFKEEYVLCTVGPSIYIYQMNQETMELDQIAFIFAQFYISTVNIIKDYILIGDACRSVQFVVWRERDNSLTLLGKDYEQAPCLSSGYILDQETLGIVVGDNEGNIHLMRYNPKVVESKKGFRLLNIADFHVGSLVTSLIPRRILDMPTGLPSRSNKLKANGNIKLSVQIQINPTPGGSGRPLISSSTTPSSTTSPSTIVLGSRLEKNICSKSCLIYGTADGNVGVLLPIDERIHRRLAVLQQIMYTTQPMSCCLNPNEYRTIKISKHRNEKKRGIIDGNLLWTFINLEESLQDELASAIGTTADVIIENLEELDMVSLFF